MWYRFLHKYEVINYTTDEKAEYVTLYFIYKTKTNTLNKTTVQMKSSKYTPDAHSDKKKSEEKNTLDKYKNKTELWRV